MPPPRLVLDAHTLRMIAISFVLLSALSIHRLWFADPPSTTDVLILEGETMGTTWEIRVAGDGLNERLRRDVRTMADERLAQVDGWMSNWNPESDVSRFNAARTTDPVPVAYETGAVVAYAVEVAKWTGGAFDVSVGPLVRLWGFGHRARLGEPPTDAEIDEALSRMGARLMRVGRGSPATGSFLRKSVPELEIDLSAIAKGYGVDHLADGLLALERTNFMVEIGGEVYASGERAGGGPWQIAIEQPLEDGRAIQAIVGLTDQAMASSGDYRIFYREGDARISHTIDPRTGRPVVDGTAAVTVVAPSTTQADAWATAIMVLGAEDGLALAEQWRIGAMALLRDEDGGIVELRNALFPETRAATTSPALDPAPADPNS